jgi:periplasmic divalent cation tolerance protein
MSERPADAVVCLVTTPPSVAAPIAHAIVEHGLAACVNVVPLVRSVYRWEGELKDDEEALLVVKTTRPSVPELDSLLREIHPYDTYELVSLEIADGSLPYLEWIADSVARREQ